MIAAVVDLIAGTVWLIVKIALVWLAVSIPVALAVGRHLHRRPPATRAATAQREATETAP